jgi:hypothetical protein
MSLIQFAVLCMGVLLVTHYAILPWIRWKVRNSPTPALVPKIAWIAVFRYTRGIVLAGFLTSLAVAGLVEVLRYRAPPLVQAATVRQALATEHELKQKLDAAHPFWFGFASILMTSALGYYTYRRRWIQCSAVYLAAQDAEISRLVRAMNEDPSWWDLPPSDEMRQVITRIMTIQEQFPNLPEQLKPSAEQALEQLRQILIQHDIVRRVQVKIDPDAIEDPEPETWRDWAAGLFGSTRVAGTTRGMTRMLYRCNALLLVAGLIGFQSTGVNQIFQDRIVSLNDLVVRLDHLEAVEQELAEAEEDAKTEAPERKEESQTSSTSTTTRIPSQSFRIATKTQGLKATAEKARTSKPSYEAEEKAIFKVTAEADDLVAKEKSFNDLTAEIRRTANEVGLDERAKPIDPKDRPPAGPGNPRERSANLRERLNKGFSEVSSDRFIKPKADALKDRLASMDPDAELRALDAEAAVVEREASKLKAAVDSRPRLLTEKLERVGHLEGRSNEIAALKQRVEWLRADTGARYSRASDELKTVRESLAKERSQRLNDIATRRARASALSSRAEAIDQIERLLPAKVDEAKTILSAVDSKVDWEMARPGAGTSQAIAAEDEAAAKVVARVYEEALGNSAPIREAVTEPAAADSAKLRALATRDAILDYASKVAPTERVRPPSLSEAPGLSPAQRNVAKSAQSIFRNDSPRTVAGRAMHDEVLLEMRRSPHFRETVIAQAQAARARLRGYSGISLRGPPGQRLWSELSQTAFDAAVERVAGADVADAIGEIRRATLSNYEAAKRYEFMRHLAGDKHGVQSALDRLAAGEGKAVLPESGRDYLRQVNIRTVSSGEVVRAIAPYEPAIEVPYERGVKLERAGSIVMEQTARGEPANAIYRARSFSEPIENYTGTFPSQPGIERVTPRGQLLEAIAREETALAKGASVKGRIGSIEAGKLSEWSAGRRFSTAASLVKNGRIELPKTILPTNAVNNVDRARNFLRLHSSPRVGGVLIGRKAKADPPAASPFHPSALRWEIGAGDVRLILVGPDGSERRSRLFRRDLTELALAYAADGRPTAVTVVTSWPLSDRKVLLHPALVDTAAGKAITRTDMIIFERIQHEPWYVDSYLTVLNQVELYRRAWAIRQSVLGTLGLLRPEYFKEVERHLKEGAVAVRLADPGGTSDRDELRFMTADTDKNGVITALTQTAREPDVIRDPSRSPLMAKTAYFDAELIADMLVAGGPGRSLDDFDGAVRKAATERLGDLVDWLKARDERERALLARIESFKARTAKPAADEAAYLALTTEQAQLKMDLEAFETLNKANGARLDLFFRRWTAPVPQLAHVSGIRERAFARTEADCFVAEGQEIPTVLDFLIQITYDSPPYFLKGVPPASEDKAAWEELASFADDAPWEFPEISGRVRECVRKGLAEDPSMAEDRDAVAILEEFTVLQRLFRLALTGELGPDFPVESLALLHREAAPAASPPPVRTPRWDTRPGLLERSLKEYADRELASSASPNGPARVPTSVVTPLKAVSVVLDEYAAKVSERDKALDALDAAPGESGRPSSSWETTWDAFQTWAEDWEDRLTKLAVDLEQSAKAKTTPHPEALLHKKGGLSEVSVSMEKLEDPTVKEKTEEIVSTVQRTVSAIALRRALDVNTDDEIARARKRAKAAASPAP